MISKEDENFTYNVKHYIKIHKELHGLKFDNDSVARDLSESFDYDYQDCLDEIYSILNILPEEYGIFLCRCQPFHRGHNEIIQEIVRDGKTPLILLGGNDIIDDRHPLTFYERSKIIKDIYPKSIIIKVRDNINWDGWFNNIEQKLAQISQKKYMTLYFYEKEEDHTDFIFRGLEYNKCHYYKVFDVSGYKIKKVNANRCLISKDILHGKDVRKNINIAKNNLDARTFRYLKDEKGWWK